MKKTIKELRMGSGLSIKKLAKTVGGIKANRVVSMNRIKLFLVISLLGVVLSSHSKNQHMQDQVNTDIESVTLFQHNSTQPGSR